jgi:adenylate kinase family enzyme
MIFGPDLVRWSETTVNRIQDNLSTVKSRQESYANKRHRPLEFVVGDHVYLKVSPMKSMKKVWNERKTSSSL